MFLNHDLTLLLSISMPCGQGPDGCVLAIALQLTASGFMVMGLCSAARAPC